MIVVDVETSSITPHTGGIISIGAINFNHPQNYFYEEGNIYPNAEISDGALRVNGCTKEELFQRKYSMKDVLLHFFSWVNDQPAEVKRIMAGHNVGFDYWFLLAEMERWEIDKREFPFVHRTIDLHTISQMDYLQKMGFQYPKDMSADFIQQKMGIPIEPSPHIAINGAVWEAECISRIWFKRSMFSEFEQYPIFENCWK